MKKLFGIVTIIVLSFSVLAGCSKEEAAGTDASPAAASPAATDTPAASPAATDTPAASPAATDAPDEPDEVVAAVDLTDYPVMWCNESVFNSNAYPSSLAQGTCDSSILLGTALSGYRLIDDTHIEQFMRYRFNDDVDTSIIGSIDIGDYESVTRINDREEEAIVRTYTYEINGTELIIYTEIKNIAGEPIIWTHQFSPDFTSFNVEGYEYTYRTDF